MSILNVSSQLDGGEYVCSCWKTFCLAQSEVESSRLAAIAEASGSAEGGPLGVSCSQRRHLKTFHS